MTLSAHRFISLRAFSSLGFVKLWSSENLHIKSASTAMFVVVVYIYKTKDHNKMPHVVEQEARQNSCALLLCTGNDWECNLHVIWNAVGRAIAAQGRDPTLLRDQRESSGQRYACIDILPLTYITSLIQLYS